VTRNVCVIGTRLVFQAYITSLSCRESFRLSI